MHARASQNQLSSEKTHMIWKTFFRVFAERSPTPHFYNEISPSRGPSFHNFDSKMAKLNFWPKGGQWDPMWSEFDSIWIKFDPNWVKLGHNEAQSIFTNSRSTAQADVMLTMGLIATDSAPTLITTCLFNTPGI